MERSSSVNEKDSKSSSSWGCGKEKSMSDCDEIVVVSEDDCQNTELSKDSNSARMTNSEQPSNINRHSRHSSTSSHEMYSQDTFAEENGRRRTSSRSSSSVSPAPSSGHNGNSNRRNSAGPTDSFITTSSRNNNGNSSSSSASAIPLTKNVGVSVNLGKSNVKSNSSSSAGAQHIISNGHQQHTPTTGGLTTSTNTNSYNNNNNSNSAAINLGHGHIGTIAGPPSVSISSGGGPSSSSIGVNHNSSLSTSPAGNAPTTCTNKGVPSSHNQQQQQHLSIPSPQNHLHRLSPHSPNLPMNRADGSTELFQQATTTGSCTNSNSSSSSSSSSSSRNDGTNNGNSTTVVGGVRTGPNSPSSTTSSGGKRGIQTSSGGGPMTPGSSSTNAATAPSASAGSKGETKSNVVPKTNGSGSTESSDGSSSSNTNRIVSQNVNGTLAVTGVPSNESELQLFRVLQRANLLSYFDMMIELGGDDVQQLCDAGEDEFLEIMALIGMASKPLHVRRLQKALQEWMTQPSLFQAPVLPPGHPLGGNTQAQQTGLPHLAPPGQVPLRPIPYHPTSETNTEVPALYPRAPGVSVPSDLKSSSTSSSPSSSSTSSKISNQIPPNNGLHHITSNNNSPTGNLLSNPFAVAAAAAAALHSSTGLPSQLTTMLNSLSPNNHQQQHQSRYNHHNNHSHSNSHHSSTKNGSSGVGNGIGYEKERSSSTLPMSLSEIKIPADQLIPSHFLETRIRTASESNSSASSIAGSPHPESRNSISPGPTSLQDHEVQKLADAAIHLIRSLPPSVAEPKFSSKKKTSGDYELILRLPDSEPRRMDEVRRVATVYGRPDAKRKTYKPLSMHELAINEAAAQLCKHVPALLTKREELLSLSRQVLRDSGLPYAAISSTFSISLLTNGSGNSVYNNNNNNDINTKSKYEELSGINRNHHPSLTARAASSALEANNGFFPGFHAKRFRLDTGAGIEIQEYNRGRSPSTHSTPSPPATSNGMQITELRSLPPRRSPSDDHLPSPLELVTVTTSDLRKNGMSSGGGSKASSVSSMDSNSPPIRRPYAVDSDDLSSGGGGSSSSFGSHLHHQQHYHGMKASHGFNNVPSIKITSIPVSGGSISITNHNGLTSNNHHFSSHHSPHGYNNGSSHNALKLLPIKSEPTVN